jgi:hypothetical protein
VNAKSRGNGEEAHAAGGAQSLIDDIAALVPKLDPSDDIAVLAMEVIAT